MMLRQAVFALLLAVAAASSSDANPCAEATAACSKSCQDQNQGVVRNFCALTPLGLVKACVCASSAQPVVEPAAEVGPPEKPAEQRLVRGLRIRALARTTAYPHTDCIVYFYVRARDKLLCQVVSSWRGVTLNGAARAPPHTSRRARA